MPLATTFGAAAAAPGIRASTAAARNARITP
jgi:hypothetical protein